MKVLGVISAVLFAMVQAQQPAQESTVAAAPQAGGTTAPATGAAAPPAASGAAGTNSTVSAQPVEQVLMSCATPHTFTPAEIKSMNQVLGIMILLLQYQLFVNDDKSAEQETYNQLLPIYRAIMNLFKNMK